MKGVGETSLMQSRVLSGQTPVMRHVRRAAKVRNRWRFGHMLGCVCRVCEMIRQRSPLFAVVGHGRRYTAGGGAESGVIVGPQRTATEDRNVGHDCHVLRRTPATQLRPAKVAILRFHRTAMTIKHIDMPPRL
jgi:hypothetical protein